MISSDDQQLLDECYASLDIIFSEFNKKYCSNCIEAPSNTLVKDVQFYSNKGPKGITYYTKEAGCCSRCYRYNGHFMSTIGLLELKKQYKFDDLYGWFDPENRCCKLPRSKRSITCLGFCCNDHICRVIQPTIIKMIRIIRDKYGLPY